MLVHVITGDIIYSKIVAERVIKWFIPKDVMHVHLRGKLLVLITILGHY